MTETPAIEALSAAEAAVRGLMPGIENIFFASASRHYVPGAERDAFRERWLGRYLGGGHDVLLVGTLGAREVWGYLVGTSENAALSARFADDRYFREEFRDACARYPAHLHLNIAVAYRGRGLGARLIGRFAEHLRTENVPGMHVITGHGMRNVGFYQRCGFVEQARAPRAGGDMVFLGRTP